MRGHFALDGHLLSFSAGSIRLQICTKIRDLGHVALIVCERAAREWSVILYRSSQTRAFPVLWTLDEFSLP